MKVSRDQSGPVHKHLVICDSFYNVRQQRALTCVRFVGPSERNDLVEQIRLLHAQLCLPVCCKSPARADELMPKAQCNEASSSITADIVCVSALAFDVSLSCRFTLPLFNA